MSISRHFVNILSISYLNRKSGIEASLLQMTHHRQSAYSDRNHRNYRIESNSLVCGAWRPKGPLLLWCSNGIHKLVMLLINVNDGHSATAKRLPQSWSYEQNCVSILFRFFLNGILLEEPEPKFTDDLRTILRQFSDLRQS